MITEAQEEKIKKTILKMKKEFNNVLIVVMPDSPNDQCFLGYHGDDKSYAYMIKHCDLHFVERTRIKT